jgi:predicted aminopeptidase
MTPERKAERLKQIQTRFTAELKPKLKTRDYDEFGKRPLNNALLLAYRTYEYSLEDFARLYARFGGDFGKTLDWLKGLAAKDDPEKALKDFVARPR